MSQILDALKKADADRRLGKTPQLESVNYQSLVTHNPRRKQHKWIFRTLSLLLLLVIFSLTYYQVTRSKSGGSHIKLSTSMVKSATEDTLNNTDNFPADSSQTSATFAPAADESPRNATEQARPIDKQENGLATKIEVGAGPQDQLDTALDAEKSVQRLPQSTHSFEGLLDLGDVSGVLENTQSSSDTPPLNIPKEKRITRKASNVSRDQSKPNISNTLLSTEVTELSEQKASAEPPQKKGVSAWKRQLKISAIVYHDEPKNRFVLIGQYKLRIGEKIPETVYRIEQILERSIVVAGDDGEAVLINMY